MREEKAVTVLLAGNPNVGKSTIFNALTGMRQHTGNWPGKTVETAEGRYSYQGREYRLVDLPGTYSLDARSQEEQVTREAILRGGYDCVAVICDGTMLRRNLILVYQILATGVPAVVCVNLMDEAKRKGIEVDIDALSGRLGTLVTETAAGRGRGLNALREQIRLVTERTVSPHYPEIPNGRRERVKLAEETARAVTSGSGKENWTAAADRFLTGRRTGLPVMMGLLFFLLWLTITGANVPSDLLWKGIRKIYELLSVWCAGWPWWLRGALLDGMLLTAGRVVAVMLPPMAIFFPLFTILEDLGYLPRMAYDLDHAMSRCGGCGKMALTMCMGLGCNAAGVVGCRIIDSPRERLMAVLTNSFIPCNGRFGALILLLTVFLGPTAGSAAAALGLTAVLVLSVLVSMAVCKLLSATVLRGVSSAFVLELPPFRMPRVGQVLVRSVLDRTLKVLGRAAVAAAPAGLLLWVMTVIPTGEGSLLSAAADALEPMGKVLGMSGPLLLAFILGWPANEIVLPVAMLAVTGSLRMEAVDLASLGLNWQTALCAAVFFLFHWPCATTCLTIRRETGSIRWTLLAVLLPTAVGAALCLILNGLFWAFW